MQALHDAILDALLNGGALSDEMVDKLLSHDGTPESIQRQRDQIEQLVQQLIERLGEQGYISPSGRPDAQKLDGPGGPGEGQGPTRFEVTDKALDFLGYRALARPARVDGTERGRPPRHARTGHGHRGGRRAARVRVRRHAEPGCVGDGAERGQDAHSVRRVVRFPRIVGSSVANRDRLSGPDGHAGRLSELVRHGAAARLQPQHGAVRRRSVHAGQACGDGA